MPTPYASGSASYRDGGEPYSSRSLTTTCDRCSEPDGLSRTVRSVTSSPGSMSNSRRTPPRSATHASFTPSASASGAYLPCCSPPLSTATSARGRSDAPPELHTPHIPLPLPSHCQGPGGQQAAIVPAGFRRRERLCPNSRRPRFPGVRDLRGRRRRLLWSPRYSAREGGRRGRLAPLLLGPCRSGF